MHTRKDFAWAKILALILVFSLTLGVAWIGFTPADTDAMQEGDYGSFDDPITGITYWWVYRGGAFDVDPQTNGSAYEPLIRGRLSYKDFMYWHEQIAGYTFYDPDAADDWTHEPDPVTPDVIVVFHFVTRTPGGGLTEIYDSIFETGYERGVWYDRSSVMEFSNFVYDQDDPANEGGVFMIPEDYTGEYYEVAIVYEQTAAQQTTTQAPTTTAKPTTAAPTTAAPTTAAPTERPTEAPKKEAEEPAEVEVKIPDDHSDPDNTPPFSMTWLNEDEQDVTLYALDIDTDDILAELEIETNAKIMTLGEADSFLHPEGYTLLMPPDNDAFYVIEEDEDTEIYVYYEIPDPDDVEVYVITLAPQPDNTYVPVHGYPIEDLGPRQPSYTFEELTSHSDLSDKTFDKQPPNLTTFTVDPAQPVNIFYLYLDPEQTVFTPPPEKDDPAQVVILHILQVPGLGDVIRMVDLETAAIGDTLALDDIERDFSDLNYFLDGVPPNRTTYTVTDEVEIIRVYYFPVTPNIPQKTTAPPAFVQTPNTCDKAKNGEYCFDTPAKTIKVPKVPKLDVPRPTPQGKKPTKKTVNKHEWAAKYDVVIYGLDAAGAVAAITAAEEGANVLVIDKNSPQNTGGFSRYCKQNILYADKIEGAQTFFNALKGGYDHLPADVVKTLAAGAANVPAWLKDHGVKKMYDVKHLEYDELPGADQMKILRLSKNNSNDGAFYNFLLQSLADLAAKKGPYKKVKGKITYAYETKLLNIIQDPNTRTVLGLEVKQGKKTYKVRALSGVILASGGFGNNEDMIENFLQYPELLSKFPVREDGDAIRAAMKIGADLWHMGNVAGYELHFKPQLNEVPINMSYSIQGWHTNRLGDRPCFIVGPNGRRFTDEAADLRLGHWDPAGEWVMQDVPQIAWAIMDQAALDQAQLYPGWSEDNQKEVDKGWLIKADTITELADAIGVDPMNLEDQFLDYQEFCDNGYDPQYHRPNDKMKKLDEDGPFYALVLYPTVHHTLGGPLKNAAGEILGLDGLPIPRLYSCGNIGSVYADIFPEGADLTEAIVFGQIAGKNAAQKK